MFSQFSDPFPLGSASYSDDKHDYPSSSLSDNGTTASSQQAAIHSDEEVLLATSYPKKRAGRRIFKETRHPIYRGVRKKNNDKWVCELREPNKKSRIWLGTYPTPEMAARAHDVAALALRGKSACLNFADSAWKLPVPVSKEAKDIRIAAHEAAELFRPQETQKFEADDGGEINCDQVQENVAYVDEEAVFDMPGYIAEMAEGLLLSPPHYAGDHDTNLHDLDTDIDVSLWSFSN